MKVLHYDAFSDTPGMGNPAGVILNADELTDGRMQDIARAVGFNETAFVARSAHADIMIRYFTPRQEMALCGHATVASLIALHQQHSISTIKSIETKAGIIDARLQLTETGPTVSMKQKPAAFIDYIGTPQEVASLLGLEPDEIETNLPTVYGSTGLWTLLVPVRRLESFQRMAPRTQDFPKVMQQLEGASLHPFCMETFNSSAQMHGRHFSSPDSGTIEDPVTGTASAVMGAYHLKYVSTTHADTLVVEQGQEMGKNGFVTVNSEQSGMDILVEIQGTGVFVREIEIA